MSTYALTVSGPSPKLAMLRAVALKASATLRRLLARVRATVVHGRKALRTAASTTLALLGSDAGYRTARTTTATLLTTAARMASAALRGLGRGVTALGRLFDRGLRLLSPTIADTARTLATRWITDPVTTAARAATRWIRTVAEVVWHLTGTGLVRAVTVRSSQAAGVLIGVHTLTQGALAARIVSALPWTMTAVVWLTQPVTALGLVAGGFLTATVTAAILLATRRATDGDDPDGGGDLHALLRDPATPDLSAESTTVHATLAGDIAARVRVEVTSDGSVTVHGIPDTLPEDLARQVAHTAADAATARLRRILLHRAEPNRDDKRLLTKAAREAVRTQLRRNTA